MDECPMCNNGICWDFPSYTPCGCEAGKKLELERAKRIVKELTPPQEETEKVMRTFDSGATRDTEDGKLDFEGFLSPLTLRRYAEYMHKHRKQSDGKIRASDNWQKGIPFSAYMKSLWRHLVDLWEMHRDPDPAYYDDDDTPDDMEEALCAIIFNASGYLHELLKVKGREPVAADENWLGLPGHQDRLCKREDNDPN